MRVLITAGGTEVPLDDVRVLTNRSKGTFLWEIAKACAGRTDVEEVVVLGSKLLHDRVGALLPPKVRFVPFRTYDDLRNALHREIAAQLPDVVFMGAAVSDYGPRAPASGKIPSDKRTLTIHLVKLPKLLNELRQLCGRPTFIVGFKLTAGANEDELIAASRRQIQSARVNLVVGNDASRIGNGRHPVTLVTPEGGAIPVEGVRAAVAAEIVAFVSKRALTTWYQSKRIGPTIPFAQRGDGWKRASRTLRFAQAAGLLTGSDGNVSSRGTEPRISLWVTPRAAPRKGTLPPERLLPAVVYRDERRVHYRGRRDDKPSIDTPAHRYLYDCFPSLAAMIHSHDAWLVPEATTGFPYPCGTLEEAQEIVRALSVAGITEAPCGIDLIHHGQLIGLEERGDERLMDEFARIAAEHEQHLAEIGETGSVKRLTRLPLFRGGRIVGIVARHPDGWASFYVSEHERKRGFGQPLVELVDRRRQPVGVHARCNVADFYLDRGFRIRGTHDDITILEPPSLRDDVIHAATCCLYCPTSGQVLLIKRKSDAPVWPDCWANPGGHIEPGETPLAAAEREVCEEVGIEVRGYPTTRTSRTLTTGWDHGRLAFRATCFRKDLDATYTPRTDPCEVAAARWFTLNEARALPLAWATRQVLREFFTE